jgi:hypothetical protein
MDNNDSDTASPAVAGEVDEEATESEDDISVTVGATDDVAVTNSNSSLTSPVAASVVNDAATSSRTPTPSQVIGK